VRVVCVFQIFDVLWFGWTFVGIDSGIIPHVKWKYSRNEPAQRCQIYTNVVEVSTLCGRGVDTLWLRYRHFVFGVSNHLIAVPMLG
jgi:hypothetical protein